MKTMSEINLKKLLTRKEVALIIHQLTDKTSLTITDALGNLILGEIPDPKIAGFPIKVAEEVLVGWIIGDKQVESFMPIITYIINQEIEKKTLAQEVLSKYHEINLFYRLSEKIASVLELEVVIKLVIEEARKLIKTSNGSLMLLNQSIGILDVASSFGADACSIPVMPNRGIAGCVFSSGIAEIVNDVLSDDRFISTSSPISSLICAPLKTRDKVIGIIIFSNDTPVTYTASDLKLFSALAGQAAKAIENAFLYAEKEEYARTLEQKVKDRTAELVATQEELIQSEKLAALGQLVAGVAHEINTPLGAVRASISNINSDVQTVVNQLPQLLQRLSLEEQAEFFLLIKTATHSRGILSSREERQFRRAIIKELEGLNLDNINEKIDFLADTFVQMGVTGDIVPFIAILQHHDRSKIMELATSLCNLISDSQNITIAVERASKIVFALKTYARYDSSEQKVPAKITESLDIILTLYSNLLKKGVEVVRKYNTSAEILCYPDELNQVWTNLIYNALQSMTYHGKLEIEVGERLNQVVVKITDSGTGIPPEVQAKIFDPFFTTKPSGEGSGLGLSIAKKIIDKHYGTIAVASIPGRTTFTVILPSL
jgi:signal transduction histidine kinase